MTLSTDLPPTSFLENGAVQPLNWTNIMFPRIIEWSVIVTISWQELVLRFNMGGRVSTKQRSTPRLVSSYRIKHVTASQATKMLDWTK